jgi:hypothetical protein
LKTEQDFLQEKKFFKSLGAPGDKRFAVGLNPAVESPVAT